MSFRDTVTLEEMQYYINASLGKFFTNDAILLEYETEDKAVSERCMVFHIGRYLIEYLHGDARLRKANVDYEYNRNFAHPKSLFKKTEKGIREKTKNAIPDLIIHLRRNNLYNLAIFEFKKGKQTAEERNNDNEKLCYFTSDKNEYRFKFGFYIELYKTKRAKIVIYMKGRAVGSYYYDYSKWGTKTSKRNTDMTGTSWLFRYKDRYHITHDFEEDLCDFHKDAWPVDELIAEPIAALCNKGYITEYSCSGHPYKSCEYATITESDEVKALSSEKHFAVFVPTEDHNARIVCDLEIKPEDTMYIAFREEYHFPSLPEGWSKWNRSIEKRIQGNSVCDFYRKVIESVEELNGWIETLPNISHSLKEK